MKTGAGNGKGTEAICPVCGKPFIRNSKGQKTCGRSCAARMAGISRKTIPAVCVVCGKEIDGTRGRKVCSDECRLARRRNIRKEKAKEEFEALKALPKKGRRCRACGKLFDAQSRVQVNCSAECAKVSKSMFGPINPSNKDYEFVRIRITKGLDVNPDMAPVVGGIYTAKKYTGPSGASYILPEIGKYGLLVRRTECAEV